MAIGLLVVAIFWTYFSSRYKIGIAYQSELPCIHANLIIIDKWDTDIPQGALASFRMNAKNEFFPQGMMWTKIVAARGGQTVDVSEDAVTVDSDTEYPLTLGYLLPHIEQSLSEIVGTRTISEDGYFMVGETITSYDSRYWGEVSQKDIIGRAYVVF